MSMKQKIFTALVKEGKEKTAAQLAAQLGTSRKSVAARVSEIRDEGYVIYSNREVDTNGRVKYFYRHSTPTRAIVRAGRSLFKALGAVGQQ